VIYLSAMSIDFPAEEESVLKRWREIDAFRRQVELSRGRKPYSKRPSQETPAREG
jgi:isoleucyl-tRNA synthetase